MRSMIDGNVWKIIQTNNPDLEWHYCGWCRLKTILGFPQKDELDRTVGWVCFNCFRERYEEARR